MQVFSVTEGGRYYRIDEVGEFGLVESACARYLVFPEGLCG